MDLFVSPTFHGLGIYLIRKADLASQTQTTTSDRPSCYHKLRSVLLPVQVNSHLEM